ncbi:MAG: MBL fold metallo-hydrolase [Bacillota bacterium]
MKITPSVYAYLWKGTGNNCNTYLITGEVNVLVDPGHIRNDAGEFCLQQLESSLAADGNRLEDINLIICTHGHPDHAEAAASIREKSKAKVAIHPLEIGHLNKLRSSSMNFPIVDPDMHLQEGELELGDNSPLKLQVIHTPGHSPGSLSYYLPEDQVLICGDVLFANSIGRTDLPDGSFEDLGQSIDRLSLLPVEWLLPGHMGLIKGSRQVSLNSRAVKKYYFDI